MPENDFRLYLDEKFKNTETSLNDIKKDVGDLTIKFEGFQKSCDIKYVKKSEVRLVWKVLGIVSASFGGFTAWIGLK